MRKTVIASFLAVLLAVPVAAGAQTASEGGTDGAKVEQTMIKFRDDLQKLEAEVVAKNVTLSADEATAFWPVFKSFQSEQKRVIDGQIAAVRTYANHYKTLTDAEAEAYVDALLARDQQIHDLRVKYLKQFAKVIGARRAARVVHLSRKLGIASQASLSEVIPLVR
jgi:Spy/CpxP family protein refolding chaperone